MPEHVYTEVGFNDYYCKEGFTIRTMIAEPVYGEEGKDINWAYIGCR